MKLIDTHCHLNFAPFKQDYRQIMEECIKKEIGCIMIGTQLDTAQKAIEIAEEYKEHPFYVAIGLHPIHLFEVEVTEEGQTFQTRGEVFEKEVYKKMVQHPKVVAVGECGFDYYETNRPLPASLAEVKKKQAEVLALHIELANFAHKPVVFHIRSSKKAPKQAFTDVLDFIQRHPIEKKGVIHCFTGDLEEAQAFIQAGFYISFTGLITFVNQWDEVIKQLPLERILVETDSPYLAPVPFRGKRNTPLNVEYVAKKIADLRGLTYEEVCAQTTRNAQSLFGI